MVKSFDDLIIGFSPSAFSAIEKYSKSLERESNALYRYVKAQFNLTESILSNSFSVEGAAFDERDSGILYGESTKVSQANRVLRAQRRKYSTKKFTAGRNKAASGIPKLPDFKKILSGLKGLPLIGVGIGVAFSAANIAINVMRKISAMSIQVLSAVGMKLQSFLLSGIDSSSREQIEFISQVNSMATLQGKSYAVAEQETLKNNKEFSSIVRNLPGNIGTYTKIYQQGLDEQLSIFGTTEKALENVRTRRAESFSVLLGKKTAESGMSPEMVIRDLSQLRNQSSSRGIGIVYSDRVLMQKFEELQVKTTAELLGMLNLDSRSAKSSAEFSQGDKRVLALYAALFDSLSPDKDKAQSMTMGAITGRLNSALNDVNTGMFGFSRMLLDGQNVIGKITNILYDLWEPLSVIASSFTGTPLDPLEFLGSILNSLRFHLIRMNRILLKTFDIESFSDFKLPSITELLEESSKFTANSINFFARIVNQIFGESLKALDDPDSIFNAFAGAFFKTLDSEKMSEMINSITGLLEKLAELIVGAAGYVWTTLTEITVQGLQNDGVMSEPAPISKSVGAMTPGSLQSGFGPNFGQGESRLSNAQKLQRGIPVTATPAPEPAFAKEKSEEKPLGALKETQRSTLRGFEDSKLFANLGDTKNAFGSLKGSIQKSQKTKLRIFRELKTILGSIALSTEQSADYFDIGGFGDIPKGQRLPEALGQQLIVKYGKYMQSLGFGAHQHTSFEQWGAYQRRGTGSNHDRNLALDIVSSAGPGLMYDEQIPAIQASIKWMQKTGIPAHEFIHGSPTYAKSPNAIGFMDTPENPRVGGRHHHHLHFSYYSGNLEPLHRALEATPAAKASYTVEVNTTPKEMLLESFQERVGERMQMAQLAAI